jgi:phosphinothricin acetyltransferase
MDINDVLIRGAVTSKSTQSDAMQIAAIYNHYVDVGGATFDREHWTTEHVTSLVSAPLPDGWYVADYQDKVLGHRVLGWASARQFSDRHGYRFACETAIYMDASSVGLRVADLLQHKIDVHCQENSIHHAMAKIIASNQRSLAFHYRHGYELVGTQKEVGHVEGKWSDVAILQKLF